MMEALYLSVITGVRSIQFNKLKLKFIYFGQIRFKFPDMLEIPAAECVGQMGADVISIIDPLHTLQ